MEEETKEVAPSGGAKRPWQATTLGVLDILGVIGMALGAILFFFMRSVIEGFLSGGGLEGVEIEGVSVDSASMEGLGSMLANLGIVFGIVLLVLAVLLIFMARGAFKGQKWSPIVSIVFAVLGVIGIAMNFDTSQIVSLVVQLVVIYLAVMCVKSPFFNKG